MKQYREQDLNGITFANSMKFVKQIETNVDIIR